MVSKVKVKKYKLEHSFAVFVKGLTTEFENDRIKSFKNGMVLIKAGNCSDGCSPKYDLPFLGVVGVWDGPMVVNHRQGKKTPITYEAFFAHDVLLEHRKELGITALECHIVFDAQLEVTRWKLASLYVLMVYKFGPRG